MLLLTWSMPLIKPPISSDNVLPSSQRAVELLSMSRASLALKWRFLWLFHILVIFLVKRSWLIEKDGDSAFRELSGMMLDALEKGRF